MDTGAREKDPQSDLKDANGAVSSETRPLSLSNGCIDKKFS